MGLCTNLRAGQAVPEGEAAWSGRGLLPVGDELCPLPVAPQRSGIHGQEVA